MQCYSCKKEGLKLPQQLSPNESMDNAARICPRCETYYCVDCLQKFSKHEDGSGLKCAACNQYALMELSGKPDYTYLAKSSEERYGTVSSKKGFLGRLLDSLMSRK